MNSSTITRYKFYMTHNMEVFQKKKFFPHPRKYRNTENTYVFFISYYFFCLSKRNHKHSVC